MHMTLENHAGRDVTILCLLQDTVLRDGHGALWTQHVEDNREGLCARGIELSHREKEQTVLTFTPPTDATGSEFTLQIREKSPRREAIFAIQGLKGPSQTAEPITQ